MQSAVTCTGSIALVVPSALSATCIGTRTNFVQKSAVFACPGSSLGRRNGGRNVVTAAKKEDGQRLYQGYNPKSSVFPAEACEEQGGEACEAEFGDEVKPKATGQKEQKKDGKGGFNPFAKKQPDREYQEYTNDKTVFQDEACDDLGGEYCEPEKTK